MYHIDVAPNSYSYAITKKWTSSREFIYWVEQNVNLHVQICIRLSEEIDLM